MKILSTVDYMVAAASELGTITIFQIPKTHPETLPESLKPKSKQVEKYLVNDLHKGAVTTLEWSKNGMKLFSGDKNGLVVFTEIDFYMVSRIQTSYSTDKEIHDNGIVFSFNDVIFSNFCT